MKTRNAELVEGCVNFLKVKLSEKYSKSTFYSSVVEVENIITEKDKYLHDEKSQILGRRFDAVDRVLSLSKYGFSTDDLQSALAPSKEDEGSEFYLIGKIYFHSSPKMRGEIDFIKKMSHDVCVREFLFVTYTIKYKGSEHRLIEETANWDSISVVASSINDFEKDPEAFIKERITKWLKKPKESE